MTQAEKDAHFAKLRATVPSFFDIVLTLARLNQPRATIIQGKIGDIEPYLIIIVFGAEACEKMIHNLHEVIAASGQGECGEVFGLEPMRSLAWAMEWMETNQRVWANLRLDLAQGSVGAWFFHRTDVCRLALAIVEKSSRGPVTKKVYAQDKDQK